LLKWKQLGVLDVLENSKYPFYVEWISKEHPSSDGTANSKLLEITIESEDESSLKSLTELKTQLSDNFDLKFIKSDSNFSGIKEISFQVEQKLVKIN
jgi:hypothetical protein